MTATSSSVASRNFNGTETLRPAFESFRDRVRGCVRDIQHRANGGADGLEQVVEDRPSGRGRVTLRGRRSIVRRDRCRWPARRRLQVPF